MSKSPPPVAEGIRPRTGVGVLLVLVSIGVVSRGEAEGQVSHASTVLTGRAGGGVAGHAVSEPTDGPNPVTGESVASSLSVGVVNRRILTVLVALVPILAFGVLLSAVTVPFVALGPGPTFDTLGEVDGKQVVDIEGTDVHPTSGHLNMTTVSQSDGLTLGQALTLWLSGRDQLVPRDLVYPPDKSKDEVDKANTTDFKDSEDNAEYAALSLPEVSDGGDGRRRWPTRARRLGMLQPGDAIDMVNNKPVANLERVHRGAEDHQAR